MKKDYEIYENYEIYEWFRLFRFFRLFRNPSSGFLRRNLGVR